MADTVQLAELVSIKFGHDLSGLAGSLTGILELIADSQDDSTNEVTLAIQTATELMLRLQLLRSAWGGVSEEMDLSTLRAHKLGLVGAERLSLDLDGLDQASFFPIAMARIVLNVMLMAAEAMPGGGVLSLSGDPASHLVIQIAGPGAAWPAGFMLCMADEAEAWAALDGPRHLQAPLTALIAHHTGMRISIMMSVGPATANRPPPLLLTPAAA